MRSYFYLICEFMKIFLVLISIVAGLVWHYSHGRQDISMLPVAPVYSSTQFNYQIDLPQQFTADDSIPELVVISKPDARLRINAGCYSSGVEGLVQSVETVQVSGLPALKESYYSDSILTLTRYTVTAGDKCFSLELSATSRDGWQDLEKLVKSFRLN
jgi:hypothetical protein